MVNPNSDDITGNKSVSSVSSSSSSSSTDQDITDDEPPLLKYTRIDKKLPATFFNRDAISAVLFNDNFFAFGTHSGVLHLTDISLNPLNTFKCHKSSIMAITADANNNKYFATASIDGTVVIGNYTDPLNSSTSYDFKRPLNSVVLDRDFEKTKTFASGGMAGELILSQRNWLGNRIDISLNKNNNNKGPILAIFNINDVLVWMNDDGITFYDVYCKTVLLNIEFPYNGKVRPDLFRPHMHVSDSDRIIISWCDHVWFLKISITPTSSNSPSHSFASALSFKNNNSNESTNIGSLLSSAASSLRATSDKKVELEHHYVLNVIVAGISSFKDDQLLVLGFENSDKTTAITSTPPELKVIDILTGEEIHSDEIVLKNYEKSSINDYHLAKHIDNSIPEYFLINSSDAIRVEELTLNDHYDWYIENEDYMKAWEIGKYALEKKERFEIGIKHIEILIKSKEWSTAYSDTDKILTDTYMSSDDDDFNKIVLGKWGDYIITFIKNNEVIEIIDYVPITPVLRSEVYDRILRSLLERKDLIGFSNCIRNWPISVYNIKGIEDSLEELITCNDEHNRLYRKEIIYLYLQEQKYSKAFPHMLEIKDTNALDILLNNDILSQFMDDIVNIVLLPFPNGIDDLEKLPIGEIEFALTKPIEVLISNRYTLFPKKVINLFSSPNQLRIVTFLYLKVLTKIEPTMAGPFETDVVELFLLYNKDGLLQFLKEKSNYNIEKAIEYCLQSKNSYKELIYLWGKIGETKKALSLIIDKLNDPKIAIEFVKNWGDSDLWEFMIGYSMDKPKFIKALLDSPDEFGKTYVEVIKGLPIDMEVDDLSTTIDNIMKENSLTRTVSENVYKIIDDETNIYATEYLKLSTKGKLLGNTNNQ